MRFFATTMFALSLSIAACGGDENSGTEKDTNTAPDSSPDVQSDVQPETEGCAEGTACDDDDACTEDDRCDAAGVCVGTAKSCDDGLSCTRDACADGACTHDELAGFCRDGDTCVATGSAVPGNGCRVCRLVAGSDEIVQLDDGDTCSDGDQCTVSDTCRGGTCVSGAARSCVSDDVCVAASCDSQLGCVETATTAACDDGNPCTTNDTCANEACAPGTTPLDCDDNDPCTIDTCDPAVGCVHDSESKCNDNDPCTNDSCTAGTGACVNDAFVGPCDDSDPCTSGEVCDAGGTCGDGAPVSCEDDNECTNDACIPGQGCLNLFRTEDCSGGTCGPALCDDAEPCTVDDRCVAGSCFGGKTASCPLCFIEPTTAANKIISLLVMADGNPGSGIDIDGDPMTCAPAGNCGGGVDNELSLLAALVNPGIEGSITDGDVKWLIDLRHAKFDGTEFPLSIYDSGTIDDTCDFQAERCEYDIAALSLDETCEPYFYFSNARIIDGRLTAGGTGDLINMVLPLVGGSLLGVTIAAARTEGTVTVDGDGNITQVNGIIAGAIPKAQLIEAVRSLDPDSFNLGITPEEAATLLDTLVNADIDLDGDGLPEAASVGMRIQTIPATIVGF